MTIGPLPMMRIDSRSSLRGMGGGVRDREAAPDVDPGGGALERPFVAQDLAGGSGGGGTDRSGVGARETPSVGAKLPEYGRCPAAHPSETRRLAR